MSFFSFFDVTSIFPFRQPRSSDIAFAKRHLAAVSAPCLRARKRANFDHELSA